MGDVCPGCNKPVRDGEAAYCGSTPNWHWDCREATLARGRLRGLSLEISIAQELLVRYAAYAKSVGCMVVGDTIDCSAEQAQLLAKWWSKEMKRRKG